MSNTDAIKKPGWTLIILTKDTHLLFLIRWSSCAFSRYKESRVCSSVFVMLHYHYKYGNRSRFCLSCIGHMVFLLLKTFILFVVQICLLSSMSVPNVIMKKKCIQWWPTIPPISIEKKTSTTQLHPLNTK